MRVMPGETPKTPYTDYAARPVAKSKDEVIDVLNRVETMLAANTVTTRNTHALAETTQSSMQQSRLEYTQLNGAVKRLETTVEGIDSRVRQSERGLKRHDSNFRRASDVDLKLASDQAAQQIQLAETHSNTAKAIELATIALQEIAEVKRSQARATKAIGTQAAASSTTALETTAQTPMLERIEQAQKKSARPALVLIGTLAIAFLEIASKVIDHLWH